MEFTISSLWHRKNKNVKSHIFWWSALTFWSLYQLVFQGFAGTYAKNAKRVRMTYCMLNRGKYNKLIVKIDNPTSNSRFVFRYFATGNGHWFIPYSAKGVLTHEKYSHSKWINKYQRAGSTGEEKEHPEICPDKNKKELAALYSAFAGGYLSFSFSLCTHLWFTDCVQGFHSVFGDSRQQVGGTEALQLFCFVTAIFYSG